MQAPIRADAMTVKYKQIVIRHAGWRELWPFVRMGQRFAAMLDEEFKMAAKLSRKNQWERKHVRL